ncbi:hypothetical protein [Alkalihalobacillus pseudalcaliphilus]|uniref:hypothetical protein n=1 Tax=Alkalihalobacillus pseudalcaliphilus TaxID=79884 RepID=UPI00064DDC30|nr:hypothetical protein [Alkalihalobacillus pseudalcaliphilus]KMK77561.1 hypothetical protein AB990_03600 [Alkalihalobacillus pseudalcaliphilus]
MKNLFYMCTEGSVISIYRQLKERGTLASEQETEYIKRYKERFFQEKPAYEIEHPNKWIQGVINSYRSYFQQVLSEQEEKQVAEQQLYKQLNTFISSKSMDMEQVEEQLKDIFEKEGYFFQGGRVTPHYGPFIWKRQTEKVYEVELPHSIQNVKVKFLDDFLLLSWLHFATFGQVYAGGWAEKDALYCIVPNYRDVFEKDTFLVSFLKHEAQHFDDYQAFPKLGGKDLEYRAKLIELIYYQDHTFLEKMFVQAISNENPHNYSSYILKQELHDYFFARDLVEREEWQSVDYPAISEYCRFLYEAHTKKLRQFGAEHVIGVI